MLGFMAKADEYAANADVKGIRNINLLEMAILGSLFNITAAGLYGGTALGDVLKEFSYEYSWVMVNIRCSWWSYEIRRICYLNESYDVQEKCGDSYLQVSLCQ